MVLGVNVDPTLQIMKETLEDRPLHWRTWWDGVEKDASREYNVIFLPTLVLIDKKGRLHKQFPGLPRNPETLEREIDLLLAPDE